MKSLAVLCLLSLLAFVYSQNYAQIGTFEGTYNDQDYGGYIYVCQNGDVLQGSYSEAGVIVGEVANDTVTGRFYQAGINECILGTFFWQLTDEGFSGFYTCNNIPGEFTWVGKKYDVFRPSDDQCAILYDGDGSVEGHWKKAHQNYFLDVCTRSATVDDDTTIHASYDTVSDGDNYPNQGYISGYSVFNDKIFLGTWYQDFVGGAVLGYLNNRQQLVLYFWTGLAGRQGGSILDASEYNVPDYHWIETYDHSLKTSVAQCDRFSHLQPYVLDALYYYEDGNIQYVYFAYDEEIVLNGVVGFDYIDYQDTNYYMNVIFQSAVNSGSYLTISSLTIFVAMLLSFF